jgi:hypothetical protein
MSPAPDEQSRHQALRAQFSESSARFRAVIRRHFQLELAYLAGAALIFLVALGHATALTSALGAIGVVGLLLFWRIGRIGPDAGAAARELAQVGAELKLTEASTERNIYPSPLIGPLIGPLILSLLVVHLAVSLGATVAALVRVYAIVRK